MSISLTQLACPSCGAPLQYRVGMPMAKCPYCETEITLQFAQQNGQQVEVETHRIRSFSTSKAEFEANLLEWLADGEYTPDDVLSSVLVSEYTGVLVPFFRFKGEYRADFTVDVGYDRQETKVRMTRNSEGKLRPKTYTETVTDWRPFHGEASDFFTLWGCASRQVPAAYMSWCEGQAGAKGAEWKDLNENDITGYVLESFETSPDDIFKARVDPQVTSAAEAKSKSRMPGDRTRNLNVEFRVDDLEHAQFYQPFWIARVEYRGETFHFLRSGSSAAFDGKRPVDENRKKEVEAAMKTFKVSAIVTAVLTVVGFFLGVLPAIPVLLIGVPLCIYLYMSGKKKQKAILERSREIRRRLLEKVKQKGGIRDAGTLSISDADLKQVEAQLVEEEAAEEERKEQEKKRKKAEKEQARTNASAVEIDMGGTCPSCDAPVGPDADHCQACGADLRA